MANNDGKAKLRHEINANLQRVYEDALSQQIPDRFKELLDQLRAKDSSVRDGSAHGATDDGEEDVK